MPRTVTTPEEANKHVGKRHFWHDGVIGLVVRKKTQGRVQVSLVTIAAGKLGLYPGGLLGTAIADAPSPIHSSYAYALKRRIAAVCDNAEAKSILNCAPEQLRENHLDFLYAQFNFAAGQSNLTDKTQGARAATYFIRICESLLMSGEPVSSVPHKCELPGVDKSEKTILSSHYDGTQPTEFLRQPLNVMNISNELERSREGLEHLKSRTNALTKACTAAIENHKHMVASLVAARQKGLPDGLNTKLKNNILRGGFPSSNGELAFTPEQRFHVAVYLVYRHELWKSYDKRFGIRLKDVESFANATFPLTQFECRYTILSEFYAPRLVIVATEILIQIATGWNSHTVLSLTADDIYDNGSSITLGAVKSKTNQIQQASISKAANDDSSSVEPIAEEADEALSRIEMDATGPKTVGEPIVIEAIRLLLVSRANIDKYCKSTSKSIFCTFDAVDSGPLYFRIPTFWHLIAQFFQRFELPKYSLDEIRGQYASTSYIENNRNIFKLQALLGHQNEATTEAYLRSTLINALSDSRMVQYMSLLRASILVSVGREERLSSKDLAAVAANNLLLFPASWLGADESDCVADQWLQGLKEIRIGPDEAQHCALQREYYRANLDELLTMNQERFAKVHFGRIVFCEALYRIIATSEYSSHLNLEQVE